MKKGGRELASAKDSNPWLLTLSRISTLWREVLQELPKLLATRGVNWRFMPKNCSVTFPILPATPNLLKKWCVLGKFSEAWGVVLRKHRNADEAVFWQQMMSGDHIRRSFRAERQISDDRVIRHQGRLLRGLLAPRDHRRSERHRFGDCGC